MCYHLTLLATIAKRRKPTWSRTEKRKTKKEKDAQKGKPTQKKIYLAFGTCGKKYHPEERCWQGAGSHLKPKRTRLEDSLDNNPESRVPKPQYSSTSSGSQSTSKKDDQKN